MIESEYTATVRDGNRVVFLTACRWKGSDEIRISITPDIMHRPYGSGFVLTGHSMEDIEDRRYLRLYGEDGFFIRLVIEDYIAPVPEEPIEEPIEYIKDKIITG